MRSFSGSHGVGSCFAGCWTILTLPGTHGVFVLVQTLTYPPNLEILCICKLHFGPCFLHCCPSTVKIVRSYITNWNGCLFATALFGTFSNNPQKLSYSWWRSGWNEPILIQVHCTWYTRVFQMKTPQKTMKTHPFFHLHFGNQGSEDLR